MNWITFLVVAKCEILKTKKVLFFRILIACLIAANSHFAVAEEPWAVSNASPVIAEDSRTDPRPAQEKIVSGRIATDYCFSSLRFYQTYLSPMLKGGCPMSPSCSRYSIQAIKKHGAFLGTILTFDRLIHEADEKGFVPLVQSGNTIKYLDPVENNDFWWYRP